MGNIEGAHLWDYSESWMINNEDEGKGVGSGV